MSLTDIKEKLFKTCYSGAPSALTDAVPNSTTPQDQQGPGGLKVKLKLNVNGHANSVNGQNGATGAGVEVTNDGEKYDGYRDLDEVKRDFDLIWGNAKRCELGFTESRVTGDVRADCVSVLCNVVQITRRSLGFTKTLRSCM